MFFIKNTMESRSNKYILPLIAALGAVTPACGGSAESNNCEIQPAIDAGADTIASPETGTLPDAAHDADADAEFASRGQVVRDLVFEVMGYSGECTEQLFPDVPASGELCRAIEIMHNMDFMSGYPDGKFRPEDLINRAELSKIISETMGYVAYSAPCLGYFKDVDPNSWYSTYMGALCENGYQLTDGGGNARPADAVTTVEWQGFKDAMNSRLVGQVTRGETARVLVEIVAGGGDSPWTCKSEYSDVADGTSLCSSVSAAGKYGIMTGYKDANGNLTGEFGPNDPLTYSQAAKGFSIALAANASNSGCSGAEPNTWYASYMDSLCDMGLIDGSWGAKEASNLSRREAYKLAWDSRILKNKGLDGGK